MSLISTNDKKLVDFIRSNINLPDWSLAMAIRGFLGLEKILKGTCQTCKFKPLNNDQIGIHCKQGHKANYLNESIKECHGWKPEEE